MEKEICCINTKAIFEYVKAHNHGDCSALLRALDPEIDALPDPAAFFEDSHNWTSCEVVSKLFERAKELLDDNLVAQKAAQYAVEQTGLGYIQRIFVKAFWSTKTALKHLQKINDKFNRSKRVELVSIRGNEAIARLYWDPQMPVTKDMCLYNQGVYQYMPLIWGGAPLSFREECCYFEGAEYCEYHLRWSARNRFHETLSGFFRPRSVLMETLKEVEEDKKIIEQKYEEVNRLNVELNQRLKQLLAVQETGKAILAVLDIDQLLKVIMNLLSNVCLLNRAIIMLVNEKEECLEYIYGVGFDQETFKAIKDYKVPLHRVSNMLVRVTNTGCSEYIPEVRSSSLKKENVLLAHGKPISAFVVPLITRSKVIGVIATDGVEGKGVPEETRETLEIFAPQIAIAIENARLYRSLEEKMEDLKRSQALLSRAEKFSFLGNLAARLAHEIKNPLTAIGTFIQLLPLKYEDAEFREDFHKVAMEETMRVNRLISELLDLVKPKESHFAFNDFHDLIEKMILLISPESKAKRIEIVRRYDKNMGDIWLDSEKMKQVILNLLSNAVEFTPMDGRIEIATRCRAKRGHKKLVWVEIRDSGMGIPASMMDKIFEPYFTTKHRSTMHNGTGLGLFIAHQNMLDHGGTIEVQSKESEGATFILTLPSRPA